MIHFGKLSYQTRQAWEDLGHQDGWLDIHDELRTWLLFEQACALFVRLLSLPDNLMVFPEGKWHSLEALSSLLSSYCVEERKQAHAEHRTPA